MPKPDYSKFSREELILCLDLVLKENATLRAIISVRDAADKWLPILKEKAARVRALQAQLDQLSGQVQT